MQWSSGRTGCQASGEDTSSHGNVALDRRKQVRGKTKHSAPGEDTSNLGGRGRQSEVHGPVSAEPGTPGEDTPDSPRAMRTGHQARPGT